MSRYHQPDFVLAAATFGLVVFGLIMISSASVVQSFEATGNNYYYFFRQTGFALIGVIGWLICQRIPYHNWKKWALPISYVALALMVAVLIPAIGYQIGGARRWIALGPLITIQVSEITKFALILYLANWFSKWSHKVSSFSQTTLPLVGLLALLAALVMLQPDLGTLGIFTLITLSIYWVAGAAIRHITLVAGAGLLAFWGLIKVAPYRLNRILAFLDPSRDPSGISYHINQALLAIGSGGLFGLGFGYSRQKYQYLPAASSDSIFAIIAEELGFIKSLLLLALFAIIISRGWRIAQRAPDLFSKLLATGITAWFGFQALINLGSIVGLLPLTGVPLPLVSLGGSSLVIMLVALGVLLNISKYTLHEESEEKKDRLGWWGDRWTRLAGLGSSRRAARH